MQKEKQLTNVQIKEFERLYFDAKKAGNLHLYTTIDYIAVVWDEGAAQWPRREAIKAEVELRRHSNGS